MTLLVFKTSAQFFPMRKYIPGGGLDPAASFTFDTSQFGNLELVAILDNLVKRNADVSWNFGIGGSVWASPAIKDGTAYFGAFDKNFYAVDILTGKEIWRFPAGDMIISTAAVDGEIIYF